VLVPTGISASDNFDASGERLLQAGDVMRIQVTATHTHVRGTDFAVEDVYGEGRNEEGATLGHHGDEFGIFVQITAVLDGVNPGFDGHTQAWSTQGVAHDTPAQSVRFFHQRMHLVLGKGDIFGAVAGPGARAAGGSALNHIGSSAHHRAYDLLHFVDTVGHPRRQRGVEHNAAIMARGADAVTNAARG
jgi:hypothetical protein